MSATPNSLALPPKLAILYGLLEPGEDVHVIHLYERVVGNPMADQRRAQQTLSAYFIRLNRRLKHRKLKVEPGALKGTYRLVQVAP